MLRMHNIFFSFVVDGKLYFCNDYIFASADSDEKHLKQVFKYARSYKRVKFLYTQLCDGKIHKYIIRVYLDYDKKRKVSIETPMEDRLPLEEEQKILNILGDLDKYPLDRALVIDIWK